MIRYTFLVIVIAIFCSCEKPRITEDNGLEQISAQDEGDIMANFNKQMEHWNEGSLEKYMLAYYPNEDVQTISRAGVTKGTDAILSSYKKYYTPENMGKLHFDQMESKRLSPEYYYVIGRFNLAYETRDTRRGYFSVLMQKINDKWYIVSDHSS